MYVFREVRTVPGEHLLEVEFGPDGEDVDRPRGGALVSSLRQTIELAPLEIALVTRAGDGTLVLR